MNTETMIDPWDALEEPSTRTPRSLETRTRDERRLAWKEPSLLPDPEPEDGWVFKWIRTASRGTSDIANVDKRTREGWTPVRAEDHPGIVSEWGINKQTGHIESGGLILCKMPEEMVRQRNETYYRRARSELTSAEDHYMRDNDQVVKKFKEAKARSTFQDRKGS